ncbi:sulfite exporter TauE/SafE family protein [Catenovulum sp. SM1970]|uniref:sulfite exporter TauE/SafE family protein n=1 Tax=Marinifaba aquimaris TaxID=2741323 RepID=UPI0015744C17|nr:sulfite exporter TauE/SafE family protein [Marinifaba aquimaris]NTS76442.1 sulfite exporter TauE/SafE family protein [Marinifaba aquimaris]
MDIYSLAATFMLTGVVAGILAGFLGIGGGLVVVPLLAFALPYAGVAEQHVMTMAVGTSLATIIFTAISSVHAHHWRENIVWPAVYSLFPGILLGSMLGAAMGSQLEQFWMMTIFGCFAVCMALYTFIGDRWIKPVWDYNQSRSWLSLVGFILSAISAIVGIGGGTLLGPWLIWLGLEPKKSIGTSAACGLFIAIFGSMGYLITGSSATDLPEYSIGYVYLPALLGIIATSVLTAPIGAKMASYFAPRVLRIGLGIALLLAAGKMFISIY